MTRPAAHVTIALFLLTASPQAEGGERLTVGELVEETQAAVLAEIEIGPAPSVKVLKVIRGGESAARADATWIGTCTGSTARFRGWLHRFPKWTAASFWRAGLRRRSYKALLFLAPPPTGGPLRPYCGTEAMLMEHTSLHPDFEDYVLSVEAAISRQRK